MNTETSERINALVALIQTGASTIEEVTALHVAVTDAIDDLCDEAVVRIDEFDCEIPDESHQDMMTALRETKSARVQLLVRPSVLARARTAAANEGVSLNEWINRLIEKGLSDDDISDCSALDAIFANAAESRPADFKPTPIREALKNVDESVHPNGVPVQTTLPGMDEKRTHGPAKNHGGKPHSASTAADLYDEVLGAFGIEEFPIGNFRSSSLIRSWAAGEGITIVTAERYLADLVKAGVIERKTRGIYRAYRGRDAKKAVANLRKEAV